MCLILKLITFVFESYDGGPQGGNTDALVHYFGEDPNDYPFEQGIR